MTDAKPRSPQLGRGLAALLGDTGQDDHGAADAHQALRTLPVERLRPGRLQPRRGFGDVEMKALADSIRQQGMLQPILVRRDPHAAEMFEIIAGERRWRAAQVAQLHEVPVIVRELSDDGALEIALVENIQREDLRPLEEAEGYRRLMEEFSHTQEDLARAVGKSRSHIANMVRLLNLPDEVKALLDEGALTAGHARALLNANDCKALAAKVVKRGLNVRQTERLVRREKSAVDGPRTGPPPKDPDTVALEDGLSNLLGLRVSIDFQGEGGRLVVHYDTLDQLDDLIQRLSHAPPRAPTARWWDGGAG